MFSRLVTESGAVLGGRFGLFDYAVGSVFRRYGGVC